MQRALNAKLTYDDYEGIPSDGKTYQIVNGEVYVTPAPSPFHQRSSKRLQRQLEAYFEPSGTGEVFDAPIDLILSTHDITQPDIVVVADRSSISRRGIEATPLLIVEVLSPSTEQFDRHVKAQRYAAFGVPHYWLLDPDERRLECYSNIEGAFVLSVSGIGLECLDVHHFPGLTIDLRAIWGGLDEHLQGQ